MGRVDLEGRWFSSRAFTAAVGYGVPYREQPVLPPENQEPCINPGQMRGHDLFLIRVLDACDGCAPLDRVCSTYAQKAAKRPDQVEHQKITPLLCHLQVIGGCQQEVLADGTFVWKINPEALKIAARFLHNSSLKRHS